MVPLSRIRKREVAEYAERAQAFLSPHSWCPSIVYGQLAWAVAGVAGVFLFKLIPGRPEVDDTLWVVVGDLPPAYLVCDETPSWRDALENYVLEMEQWVAAVREGQPLDDVIPVDVAPTREHADMSRLG